MSLLLKLSEEHFLTAEAGGFAAFTTEIRDSNPVNASPYLIKYRDFLDRANIWSGRGSLCRSLDRIMTASRSCGISVEAALIGGSFTDLSNPAPRDIDCLLLYRKSLEDQEIAVSALQKLEIYAKSFGGDVRFAPLDGDPILLLKVVSFFSTLFTVGKPLGAPPRGLVLIDCRM